eukprot:TRINITY_DN338_c0_g2_i1.p1 TRINITY_DN338_c0_g2~~TRINITY_DN338_c0_g2_i1.p1  ORF type:complete len:402 (-),score=40.62 TRINITY_DN338_c0_g2_i1:100-1305(-)
MYLQDYGMTESNVVITSGEPAGNPTLDPLLNAEKGDVYKSFYFNLGEETRCKAWKDTPHGSECKDIGFNFLKDSQVKESSGNKLDQYSSKTQGHLPKILIELNDSIAKAAEVVQPLYTPVGRGRQIAPRSVIEDQLLEILRESLLASKLSPQNKTKMEIPKGLAGVQRREITLFDIQLSTRDLEALEREELSEKLLRFLLVFFNSKYRELGTMASQMHSNSQTTSEYYGDKIHCFLPEIGKALIEGYPINELIKQTRNEFQRDSVFSFYDKVLIPFLVNERWHLVKISIRRKLTNNNIIEFAITVYSPSLRNEISLDDLRSKVYSFILAEYIAFNNNKVYKERIKHLLQVARFKVVSETPGPDGSALFLLKRVVSLINREYQEQITRASLTTFFYRIFTTK